MNNSMMKWISEPTMKIILVKSWWRVALFKIFGKMLVSCDSGYCFVFYSWRGKLILLSEHYYGPTIGER